MQKAKTKSKKNKRILVMLNLFQHLYLVYLFQILKQVQDDGIRFFRFSFFTAANSGYPLYLLQEAKGKFFAEAKSNWQRVLSEWLAFCLLPFASCKRMPLLSGPQFKSISKFIATIIIFFFFSSAYSQTTTPQKFSFGVRAGINTAQVLGTSSHGFGHFGFSGGVKFGYRFESRWSFDPEILYNMKGAARYPNVEEGDYYSFSVDLDYIEVPMLFNYYFGKKRNFSFEFGPSIGFVVRQKAYENNSPVNSTNTGFNIYDISLAAGFNYHLPKGFSLNLRYMNSIIPIQPTSGPIPWGVASFNLGSLNSFFTFALVYKFNFAKKVILETGQDPNKPVKEKKEKKQKKQKGNVVDED